MIHALLKRVDTEALFALQQYQYSDRIPMADTVSAGQSSLAKANVSNLGHFLCTHVTGHFQTARTLAGVGRVDEGVNHLRGQLIDGAGQRKIFSDYVPFDLWLSPGRTRHNGTAAAPCLNVLADVLAGGVVVAAQAVQPYPLFYPVELEYLFTANSDIQLDVKNDSDEALSYEIVFHGIRVLSSVSTRGISPVRPAQRPTQGRRAR